MRSETVGASNHQIGGLESRRPLTSTLKASTPKSTLTSFFSPTVNRSFAYSTQPSAGACTYKVKSHINLRALSHTKRRFPCQEPTFHHDFHRRTHRSIPSPTTPRKFNLPYHRLPISIPSAPNRAASRRLLPNTTRCRHPIRAKITLEVQTLRLDVLHR